MTFQASENILAKLPTYEINIAQFCNHHFLNHGILESRVAYSRVPNKRGGLEKV